MPSDHDQQKLNYLISLLRQKCPRCRTGDMFKTTQVYDLKHFMKMNEECPACGQHMEIEPGFYYGTSYVSYALTVAISCVCFVGWWIVIGFSLSDNRFFWWIGFNIVLLILIQPFIMRLSRSIWLSFFVHFNPRWQKEDAIKPERK